MSRTRFSTGLAVAVIALVLGTGYVFQPGEPQHVWMDADMEEVFLAELSGASPGKEEELREADMEFALEFLEQDEDDAIISLAEHTDLEEVIYSDETLTEIMEKVSGTFF